MDYLARYRALGFSVIPLVAGQKVPALASWLPYTARLPLGAETAAWWPRGMFTTHGIGIVAGEVSGNLVVIDCDDMDTARDVTAVLPRETMTVLTSRGMHLYYRADRPVSTSPWTLHGHTHHVKAHGSYVVAPPSRHPDGPLYRLANDLDPLPLEAARIADALRAIGARSGATTDAQERPQAGWVAELLSRRIARGERHDAFAKLAGYLSTRVHMDETCEILRVWMESRVDGYEDMVEYHRPEAQVRRWYEDLSAAP